MIIGKTELTIRTMLRDFNSDMNYIKILHQANITIDYYDNDEYILEKIERFPKNTAYLLIITNPQSKALNLMNNYTFIKMINKLRVRIQCGGIEIETKRIDKNGIKSLREKLEKEINDKKDETSNEQI